MIGFFKGHKTVDIHRRMEEDLYTQHCLSVYVFEDWMSRFRKRSVVVKDDP